MASEPVITLRVSDMQFGAGHGFGGDQVLPSDRRHSGLAARLLQDAAYLSGEYGLRIDLVAVTGDLTQEAKPREFDQKMPPVVPILIQLRAIRSPA